jgi:hypothetical protein
MKKLGGEEIEFISKSLVEGKPLPDNYKIFIIINWSKHERSSQKEN